MFATDGSIRKQMLMFEIVALILKLPDACFCQVTAGISHKTPGNIHYLIYYFINDWKLVEKSSHSKQRYYEWEVQVQLQVSLR